MPVPDDHSHKSRKDEPAKEIRFKNKPLGVVTQESLDAIAAANNPPTLFQQNGNLVRVRRFDEEVIPEQLTIDSLRYHLGRSANFVRIYFGRGQDSKERVVIDLPPQEFIRDVLACPDWDERVFPTLKGVVKCPYFTAAGKLVTAKGYDTDSRLWYEPDAGFILPEVPANPTDAQLAEAKRWIVSELLYDFPFQSEADRTNAVAYLVTPFVREMINGCIPMGLCEAAVAGTGKGLLANAIAIPATGSTLETIPQRDSEDEWRKVFTAKLLESPTFVMLDNLTGTLKAPALEALLTTGKWTDRILGETRMARLKPRATWLATGNNLQLGGDLPRRVVWMRLDAKMERPEERKPDEFKHADLVRWAVTNRPHLVWAALVIVQNWIAKGCVPGKEVMGSYESWTGTLGGILRDGGFTGFITNVRERRRDGDEDLEQLKRFVYAWYKEFQFETVTAKDLFPLVATLDLLPQVMAAETEQGRKQKLGHYLGRMEDKVVGQFQLVRLKDSHRTGVRKYQIIDLKPQAEQKPATNSSQASKEDLERLGDMLGLGGGTIAIPASQPDFPADHDTPFEEDEFEEDDLDDEEGGSVDPDELDA